ncbi:PREDICTED: FGGY carbohydrate kinase domain-containing protein-like [Amphimedon queenslandica]|uniref:Carbohydrate kinase FGGY C-terminal domain-containing protein n=1 Tax=Amphimedon queenslandica TaxID=400682 RepID=A0AAN0JIG5_AMPQE|nr:PREDICTED: FGGY carbohydrate kinase domain-containing protein-like [Amphimedon queenslandica]|eukprot:XP_019856463.1 PREDICTED: FGGY carbohydrate kinase domain-containing protein-like [Amphimedon queenslandica]
MASNHYLSVDVGTGSVRAALWGQDGECLSRSVCPIRTWTNEGMPEGSYESLCTLTCKWTYIAHDVEDTTVPSNDEATNGDTTNVRLAKGWNDSFWCSIGLECLVNEEYKRIGTKVQVPGRSVGLGLSERAAVELGLTPGTPVATGIIDAHAGGLGMLGADTSQVGSLGDVPLTSRLALIGGTSSCHMMSSDTPLLVPGVWGPYYSAMIPGLYLNEGGQSASGALIDYVLHSYPGAYRELEDQLNHTKGITSVHQLIESRLTSLSHQKGLPSLSHLTAHYHVLPDHHGNRSPLADPTLRGMVSGLSLGQSVDDLSIAYLATMQALAYNTKHIIEAAETSSEETQKEGKGKGREGTVKVLFICGGLSSNPIFLHTQSDITGLPVVVLSDNRDAVLLGSAILAATASTGEDVSLIMARMSSIDQDKVIYPDKTPSLVRFHQSKYKVFKFLYEDQYKYRRIMNEGGVM